MVRSKFKCPNCGSRNNVRMVYGLPDNSLMEKAELGKVALGGCVLWPESPGRHCNDCGHEW